MNKNDEAFNYVMGTNGLEDIKMSKEDLERIMQDIQKGKKDKSFLYELIQEINRRKQEIYGEENGRGKV